MKSSSFSAVVFYFIAISICSCPSFAKNAGSTSFTMTVNVTEAGCTLSTASEGQTVNLGVYDTRAFSGANSASSPVAFTVLLEKCTADNVSVTFTGNADASDTSLLALTPASTAKNVAIELLDKNKQRINLNETADKRSLNEGGNTLTYYARYVATASNVNAGSADGVMTFSLTYN